MVWTCPPFSKSLLRVVLGFESISPPYIANINACLLINTLFANLVSSQYVSWLASIALTSVPNRWFWRPTSWSPASHGRRSNAHVCASSLLPLSRTSTPSCRRVYAFVGTCSCFRVRSTGNPSLSVDRSPEVTRNKRESGSNSWSQTLGSIFEQQILPKIWLILSTFLSTFPLLTSSGRFTSIYIENIIGVVFPVLLV